MPRCCEGNGIMLVEPSPGDAISYSRESRAQAVSRHKKLGAGCHKLASQKFLNSDLALAS